MTTPNDNPTPGPESTDTPKPDQKGTDPKSPADAREWVPEPLRGHKSLEKFKTAGDAVQAYINLESAYGKKFEEHLKADAPDEIKARVRTALGVPESAAGYDDPKTPEGHELNKTLVGGFKDVGHKLGLSKSQASGLMDWFLNVELSTLTTRAQEADAARETSLKALHQQWGAATARNVALIHQLVAEHGGDDVKAALDETGAGNDPRVLRWLAKLGAAMQEDGLVTPNPVGLSQEDAKTEIAAIRTAAMQDKKHPYTDKNHPEHKAILKRMEELNQLAYSEV